MQKIDLDSWEKFEERLKTLESERLQHKYGSKFLYRGQENSADSLLTTLERYGQELISVKEYHHLISAAKPQIESFTGVNWNILSYPAGIDKWLSENDTFMPNGFIS